MTNVPDIISKLVENFERDFDNIPLQSRHDRMVHLVDTMLDLHKRLQNATTPHDKSILQRQIDTTDRHIDSLVYDLYGLSESEISVVEGE